MDQLEKFLEDLFTKKITFALPIKAKELIVIVLSLPAIFTLFGLGSFVVGMGAISSRYYIGLIVLVIQVIFMIMAFPGLQKRLIKGWKMMYYSNLISVVYALFSSYSFGDLVWTLLGSCIGFYLLFQIKSYYK